MSHGTHTHTVRISFISAPRRLVMRSRARTHARRGGANLGRRFLKATPTEMDV